MDLDQETGGNKPLPKAEQDHIDLNNELAGREVGRPRRFLPEDSHPDSAKKRREKERAEQTALMIALSDPAYATLYHETLDKLRQAELATEAALTEAGEALDQAKADLKDGLDGASTLPDGTRVFRDAQGNVFTEDGMQIDGEELDTIQWRDGAISHEEYLARKKAMEEAQQAAEAGDASAMDTLGGLYCLGKGVSQDYAEAAKWFERAAENGNANAMTNLGVLNENGWGVSIDYTKAAEWYQRAAEAGDLNGMSNLGNLCGRGCFNPHNPNEVVKWLQQAAEAGVANANDNLGVLYALGKLVPQDYSEAAIWFQRAADKGMANAATNLGALYMNGQGVPKDIAKAAHLFRQAAEQGDTNAMRNLGNLYRDENWPLQDINESNRWFRLADETEKRVS